MACLNYEGFTNRWGYGLQYYEGRTRLAHRVAYVNFHDVPLRSIDGELVRHTCDNPTCINPEHLLLGTQQDNMDDKMRRGRHKACKGTANGRARLEPSDVKYIREHYKRGSQEFGTVALGRKFGLHDCTIGRILRKELWSHV